MLFKSKRYHSVAGENVRASWEKSGNHLLENLPTFYYKYVYVLLCIQSCPKICRINIPSSKNHKKGSELAKSKLTISLLEGLERSEL
jgi:hypothetical protein